MIAEPPMRPPIIDRVAIGDLLRRAGRRYGAYPATREDGRATSFAELDRAANRVANALCAEQLTAGAKVVTLCENSTEFLATIFGIHKSGRVWVPINTMLAVDDIRYIVEHCEAELVIVDAVFLERPNFAAMLADLRLPCRESGGSAWRSAADGSPVAALEPDRPETEPDVEIRDRDLALIMYTSGTTSRPKGVMHTHLALYFATLGNIAEDGPIRGDISTCMMPMFHCAQHALCLSFLAAGCTMVMLKGFDADRLIASIEEERISFVFALPLMYAALLAHPERATRDLTSLRHCLYAMAPMPKPLLLHLIDELCPRFALGSGQTEIFPMTTLFKPEEQLRRFGNYWGEVGIIDDLVIMDDDGAIVADGVVGEIVHRGPNAMIGYIKDQPATTAASGFGWHHTGDLGLIDPDGQLLFVDRKKDMIKSGGENVASVKVEEVLLRHPAVANAAVVGLPHPRWTEAVAGFVTLKPGQSADSEAIIAHCRTHLSGYETPKLVAILDKFQTTATGKIQKNSLRDEYRSWFATLTDANTRTSDPNIRSTDGRDRGGC